MEDLPVSVARLFSGEPIKTQKSLISNAKMITNAREQRGGKLGENVKNVGSIFV